MTEYVDEVDDYSLPEYIVLWLLSDGPIYRSGIMRKGIAAFGDIVEHGPYLYGEYSDDLDEAVDSLLAQGLARYIDDHRGRIVRTEYGTKCLAMFTDGGAFEDDDWETVRKRMVSS